MTDPDPWRTAAEAWRAGERYAAGEMGTALAPAGALIDAAVDAVARGYVTPELRAAVLVLRPGMVVAENPEAEIDRILSMTDEEILAEVLADGVDIAAEAERFRALFRKAECHAREQAVIAAAREVVKSTNGFQIHHLMDALTALDKDTTP